MPSTSGPPFGSIWQTIVGAGSVGTGKQMVVMSVGTRKLEVPLIVAGKPPTYAYETRIVWDVVALVDPYSEEPGRLIEGLIWNDDWMQLA